VEALAFSVDFADLESPEEVEESDPLFESLLEPLFESFFDEDDGLLSVA
jgi:hypothetical protein